MSRVHGLSGALGIGFCALSVLCAPARSAAQSGGDEVIDDPELGASAPSAPSSASAGEEVISDPELSGPATAKPAAHAADSGMSPSAPPASEVHLVLHARANHDLLQEDPREEIW